MRYNAIRFKQLIEERKSTTDYNKKFNDEFEKHMYGATEISFVLGFRQNALFSTVYEILRLDEDDINYLYNKYVTEDALNKEMNNKINEIKKQYGN